MCHIPDIVDAGRTVTLRAGMKDLLGCSLIHQSRKTEAMSAGRRTRHIGCHDASRTTASLVPRRDVVESNAYHQRVMIKTSC